MTAKALHRFQACGIHFLGSLGIALLAAGLVFWLWYPGLLAYASGVTKIFLLLLAVDLVLGPLITLIIFNPAKKELRRDLTIVVAIQIAALLYGLYTVFIARPVYTVYNGGRFDVVYANDIAPANLAKAANPQFQSLPVFGPRMIAARLPADKQAAGEIVSAALSGGDDVQHLPQYYLNLADAREEMMARIQPLEKLRFYNRSAPQTLDALIEKYRENNQDVGFLPLKGAVNNLTVIVRRKDGEIIEFVKIRPGYL